MAKDIHHGAFFDDLTGFHHSHAITNVFDHGHLVGNDHQRQSQLTINFLQKRQNRTRRLGVQCTRGFVT